MHKTRKLNITPALFVKMAVMGLTIVLCLNLTGLVLMGHPAANISNEAWWTTWFPSYACWLGMLLVAGTLALIRRRSE